jgi:hypothetical protein
MGKKPVRSSTLRVSIFWWSNAAYQVISLDLLDSETHQHEKIRKKGADYR